MVPGVAFLMSAVHFAATRHRAQRRKDGVAPYINHPIEVAELLAVVGGVTDLEVLAAGLLHDTVEDTGTRPEEVEAAFGTRVKDMVVELSDDKSLPKQTRKELQVQHAPTLSAGAKQIKLCDLSSNVASLVVSPPPDWSVERRREYVEWAARVSAGLCGSNPSLEAHLASVIEEARRKIAPA